MSRIEAANCARGGLREQRRATLPAVVDTAALKTACSLPTMESPASVQTSGKPAEISACFLVFGQSLKMHALRHVLHTLEMNLLDTVTARRSSGEFRIAFDGCDAEACAAKAAFIRSLGPTPAEILLFPISRVPEIAPLFEPQPILREQQGTIFDPKVEVFRNCWNTHGLCHFTNKTYKSSLPQPERTRIPEFLRFAGFPHEVEFAKSFVSLVELLEAKIEGWWQLQQERRSPELQICLAAWNAARKAAEGRFAPGPLDPFCSLLHDLDTDSTCFETTVAKLAHKANSEKRAMWATLLNNLQ